MNKQECKELIAKYKENQQKQFNSSLPITKKDFKALFDYLDSHIDGCQHDFVLAKSWLSERGLPVYEVLDWFRNNGAGCDCEILLNVEEKFQ